MARPSKAIRAEYITVSELAETVGRSCQSIYKKMKDKPSFNQYVRVFDGKKFIHKSAIWEEFGIEVEGVESVASKESQGQEENSAAYAVLEKENAFLRETIEDLRKAVSSLTDTIKAEQVLRANADKKIQFLEDRLFQKEAAADNVGADPGEHEQTDNHEESGDISPDRVQEENKGTATSTQNTPTSHASAQGNSNMGSAPKQPTRANDSIDRNHQSKRPSFLERLFGPFGRKS